MLGRETALRAITEANWNTARAAQRLGMHPNTFAYQLRRLGIQRPGQPSLRAVVLPAEAEQLGEAAVRLQELRRRAVVIRNSQRLTPPQKEHARRVLAAELLQATTRYRALAAATAASLPPAAIATMHGAHRQW
jgi:hypothetical protein